MSVPNQVLSADDGLNEWAVLAGYRGSVAHGTWLPTKDPDSVDDKDLMAFCVPPQAYFLGLRTYGSKGTKEVVCDLTQPSEMRWDVVIYEIRKAVSLLEKGNPNVLSMLWLPETLYTKVTGAGNLLLAERDIFAGKHVYNAYVGYAKSQLSKMQRGKFEGYMGDKRKALVELHGYDTKNAVHLVRLLRQGIEFLSTGELVVQRPDAPELLDIKRGMWSLERVQYEADYLFRQAHEALIHSDLPCKPDRDRVSKLCQAVVERAWWERVE